MVKQLDQRLVLERLRSVRAVIWKRSVSEATRRLDQCGPVELGKEALDESVVGLGLDELELDVLEDEREVVRGGLACLGVASEQIVCEQPHRVGMQRDVDGVMAAAAADGRFRIFTHRVEAMPPKRVLVQKIPARFGHVMTSMPRSNKAESAPTRYPQGLIVACRQATHAKPSLLAVGGIADVRSPTHAAHTASGCLIRSAK
ncbi:hypothetical protein L1887_60333 [Cichorium endivia]|nr:hypothetical protein L1887_60333 [Cichorium endivia]